MAASRPDADVVASIRTTGRKIDFYKRNALARRMRLIERLGIDLVLDVGANTGQYARGLRRAKYQGRMVSFEVDRASKRVRGWHNSWQST
jgi:hypothetical protein